MDKPLEGEKIIKIRAALEDIEFLKNAAGGDKMVSNLIRRAIKKELVSQGLDVPEWFMPERPAGNWTKGDNRRGKENRQPVLN